MNNCRNQANKIFKNQGLPNTKHEDWKHTSLSKFNNLKSYNNIGEKFNDIDSSANKNVINIINGIFDEPSSSFPNQFMNVFTSSSVANKDLPDKFMAIAEFEKNPLIAYNTSMFEDAVIINVKENTIIDELITINRINYKTSDDVLVQPRIFINCSENSSVKLLVHSFDKDAKGKINAVTEIKSAPGSNINLGILNENSDTCNVVDSYSTYQMDNSTINLFTLTIGGELHRSNIDFNIKGSGCNNKIGMLMLGKKNNHIDCHFDINHYKNMSNNELVCRSVVNDSAHVIFNGKIIVSENAVGTDSTLYNKNLLLSDTALVNSNPQLEINCDEIKCAHGSTSGYIDNDSLFYLQSRGISKQQAKNILIKGFLSEVVDLYNPIDNIMTNDLIDGWM